MAVSITDAVKRFGTETAVDGISVEIPEGAFFTVLGPSGCGKSTLLRLIAGLEPLDGGEIRLGGATASGAGIHVPPEDRDVAVVFQTYALWPHMDVTGNVSFPLECDGMPRVRAREAAQTHLQTVSLTPYATRKPAELSGGQRQRVALARCLASGARIVLMDEPLANLDPHLRTRMEEELAAFHAASGATIIYITHDQREAMALATRIAVMENGRFAQEGTPEEVHDRPASEHVARFIGQSAVLQARFADGLADLGPAQVPLTEAARHRQGPGRVVIRPADLSRTDPGSPGALRGTVSRVTYRGGHWEALAEVPGLAEPLPFTCARPLQRGEAVSLRAGPVWAMA
ncbi:Spermidine/putrescine import ATP-binding protein PotA [Pseudooceanicola marinus]|uniref:Spermidine/putrescine import ATP-binding protein PotA n=1 Tax=Pseudooceanicola marinus TaxID=396013 RepID=A0A1X6ZGT7_9RHOB|nr:ABC transporter ATP-binding protein [Pseudooceanicola marinus]PJE28505.1 ABC transporter ATP-binding protein [Pseudooceanicola marinus]SLN50603.1 Spermidine/putrescine import ATP-binding protein PotA [Pseudooceanicola marinus]